LRDDTTIDERLGPPGRDHQQILNSDWPKYPTNFVYRAPMPVWVRVEWARDGEQWCPGVADRWNKWFVRVKFIDEPRAAQGLTWVRPYDVRRRDPGGGTGRTAGDGQSARGEAAPGR
jgi:hypothetical protein